MVLKRKRNLKIDTSISYAVFLVRDLDINETEDYIENRDTGMEADEEKEVHLQNIMKGTGDNIPIPVICEIENESRKHYKKRELKKRIIWEKDCTNEYIETEQDIEIENKLKESIEDSKQLFVKEDLKQPQTEPKQSFIPIESFFNKSSENMTSHPVRISESLIKIVEHESTENIPHSEYPKYQLNSYKYERKKSTFQDLIRKIGNDKNLIVNKNEDLINYCLRRTLIRYEKNGYEAYTCFRDRIFNPTFKSRRNETLMYEKINRMGTEFNTMRKMCQLQIEKCQKEYQMYEKTFEIIDYLNKIEMNEKKKKQMIKMMFRGQEEDRIVQTKPKIFDLMVDRQKIVNLRNMKSSTELFLEIKYYNEVMSLVNKTGEKLEIKRNKEK